MRGWMGAAGGILIAVVWPLVAIVQAVDVFDSTAAGERAPVVSQLFPPGVALGGEERWLIEGRNLGGVERVLVEGGGVEVEVVSVSDRRVVARARANAGATPGYREVRVEGRDGVSNLRLIRVDKLSQVTEAEPNDQAEEATEVPRGMAGAGILQARDVDHFRVRARGGPGVRTTIEMEARRLGASVSPVLTVLSLDGRSLLQGRETLGVEGDCRLLVELPEDGEYLVQVRDNLWGGDGGACYRLRVTEEPFATAIFPLGGAAGKTLRVTASGGNLPEALFQNVLIPERSGATLNLPAFRWAGGLVETGRRLLVGAGVERLESGGEGTLNKGEAMNGMIAKAGEIDRFRLQVERRELVELRVRAERLGSWLDSVLTVRNARGEVVAENDDPPATLGAGGREQETDSRIGVRAEEAGQWVVELIDRYGRGGAEYGYRLERAPFEPDFAIRVNLKRAGEGEFNTPTNSEIAVPFAVVAEGATGPITVSAEGLPEGVRSEPVVVRVRGLNGKGAGELRIKVGRRASAALSRLRVVGTARLASGKVIEREGSAEVQVGTAPVGAEAASRTAYHQVQSFPIRVTRP